MDLREHLPDSVPGQILLDDDPREPILGDAIARVNAELEAETALSPLDKLQKLAFSTGNIAEAIDRADLVKIGHDVVDDYNTDKEDRKDWEDTAKEALEKATQEKAIAAKNFPWPNASNVNYPILASAMLQFNARAYPAIVKGDEAVLCKVIGRDEGKPELGPDGQPMALAMTPEGPKPFPANDPPPPDIPTQPMWKVPPGAKSKRAQRVSEYMNTTLFYRMYDWEADTDSLLMQLPVVGCVFRKVWYDTQEGKQKAAMVSALNILVPEGARSCETTPRLTEEIPDVYPSQISEDIRTGRYIEVDLFTPKEPEPGVRALDVETKVDKDKPRLLLEQHRLIDLDEDGCPEPYIVTVDCETREVLRIEANFGPGDIKLTPEKIDPVTGEPEVRRVMTIKKGKFFIKYEFWPHPAGKFYSLGLGHLLKQLGDVIDTAINQLMDAGTAQTAGGGFIASGVRLQSRGQGSVVRIAPGEYKTVDVPGDALRNAIVERTLPNVSPVTFQILDLILGAAKEISGIKDVITGEASNTGQVGTTLALIEQGLQVFNAIYKRVFRSLKEEFQLLFDNIGKYGGEQAAQDYSETLDDPQANFEQDFSSKDLDIRPVSDPSSVTQMQRSARANFLLSSLEQIVATGGNGQEVMKRVLEAANVEDPDKIYPAPTPEMLKQQEEERNKANMAFEAKLRGEDSQAAKNLAAARKATSEAAQTDLENQIGAATAGARVALGGLPDGSQVPGDEREAA